MIREIIAVAAGLLLLAEPALADAPLSVRDPDASYFDVPARRSYLAQTSDPILLRARDDAAALPAECPAYRSPPPKAGPYSIPPYYGDRHAWQNAVGPYHDLQLSLTRLGMRYVSTGDRAAARCLVSVLAGWAEAGALLDFRPDDRGRRQAWYLTTWTAVSAAMAYSLVRGEPEPDSGTRQDVESWINRVARNLLSVQTNGTDNRNNHAHWRALAATAAGVVSDDDELFATGISGYRRALAALSRDGSWPLEMARGGRAIHYQNFALEPLFFVRALAERQGIDPDGPVPSPGLDAAVSFLLSAIEDPGMVRIYTREAQDLSFMKPRPTSSPLAGLEIVANRNPSPRLENLLAPRRPLVDRRVATAATLYFYRPGP